MIRLSYWTLCCLGLLLWAGPVAAAPKDEPAPAKRVTPQPATPAPAKTAPAKAAPAKAAPTKAAPAKKQVKKQVKRSRRSRRARRNRRDGDEFNNEDMDRYRYRYRDPRSRRYRKYLRYRRYRRKKKFKGPSHRASRFFWSTEVGYGMFRYMRYTPGIEPPFHFNSFIIGGRWGFASRLIIFTGDIMYGFGNADNLRDGGFLGHLGVTLSVLPLSYFSLDFGTGLRMVTSFDSSMNSPALLFPIDVGFTFRIPWKTVSLGIRTLGSFSFGLDGVGIGFHAMLVLSRT